MNSKVDFATTPNNGLQLTIITTTISNDHSNYAVRSNQFYIGVSLALLSSLFIGSSFILKKKGLLKLTSSNKSVRAGLGGFGYLKELQWWVGLATMGLGELCNFAAYGFAPASVVTPLGALSVLVSALMAVRFLGEKLDALGKIGCFLTVCGSIVLVIHAPRDSEVSSLLDFARKIGAIGFLSFSLLICIAILCLILYYAPRLGSKYVHVYILICSLLGAFTVTACKGLGAGLKEIATDKHTYSMWLTFSCALVIIVSVIIQMIYLNRALDLFATPVVTTVYYVLFTTCVLITSGILFREWRLLAFVDIFACLVGFSITTCGLILINYLKTNTLPKAALINDESRFPYLVSHSQISSLGSSGSMSEGSVKQQQQQHGLLNKSYANLLLDDSNLPITTNLINEQRQPMLLIDDYDFTS